MDTVGGFISLELEGKTIAKEIKYVLFNVFKYVICLYVLTLVPMLVIDS